MEKRRSRKPTNAAKGRSSDAVPQKRSRCDAKRRRKKDNALQVHVWDIRLTPKSRKSLNKVKDTIWGTVAHAIEWGSWYIPTKDYVFGHIKDELEKGMRKFFNIDDGVPVEVKDFMTNIIEYEVR